MKILLHACCGPCATFPWSILKSQGHTVHGVFFNPNLYPRDEHEKRWEVFRDWAKGVSLPVSRIDAPHTEWLDSLGGNLAKPERCLACYKMRLRAVAKMAKACGCDGFSTTLFVSPYQHHDGLKDVAENVAREFGVALVYRDYRPGYRRGKEMARGRHMYMQRYCGCEFSLGDDAGGIA